jgi:predicted aldo/keto reductase-like oxidoreductase
MKQINNISILGFGCMRLPDNFNESESLVMQAIEKGVNYFDTAYIYPGKEALLGKILYKNNMREKVKIATKLPHFLCRSYTDFDKYFGKSLSRLKTNYIDYYLLHMLNNLDELQQLWSMGLDEWIEEKKQNGQIKHIGFSFHGKTGDFIKIIDNYEWEFCMLQYNYLDVTNQAGITGLKYAHTKGIPVIIMEPLRGGLLADQKKIPPKAMEIFKKADMSPAPSALKWIWNHEEVTCVLSGMKNASNFRDNLAAAEASHPNCMTPEELTVIDKVTAIFKEVHSIPCTGCNYCMPCPVGVNIPACFSTYNEKDRGQYMQCTGAITSKRGLASSCISCGKCESLCPQSIPIQESLKAVKKKMEPWWFKFVTGIARQFTKKKHRIKSGD